MLNDFCPDCGAKLEEPRDIRSIWLRLLKCPNCAMGDFLEVGDSKSIYPLQRLQLDASKKLLTVDEALLQTAAARIRHIDYKTVSIVDFEQTILGCYHPERSYRIVYPDGSER